MLVIVVVIGVSIVLVFLVVSVEGAIDMVLTGAVVEGFIIVASSFVDVVGGVAVMMAVVVVIRWIMVPVCVLVLVPFGIIVVVFEVVTNDVGCRVTAMIVYEVELVCSVIFTACVALVGAIVVGFGGVVGVVVLKVVVAAVTEADIFVVRSVPVLAGDLMAGSLAVIDVLAFVVCSEVVVVEVNVDVIIGAVSIFVGWVAAGSVNVL